MAEHFVRSVTVVNLLASIHGVKLLYSTRSQRFGSNLSLFRLIFDEENSRFNKPFLKLHQANTIYLYSRACILVQHP